MPQRSTSRAIAIVRPLAPYEPAPSPTAPAPPAGSPPTAPRDNGNQLTLPLRGEHAPGMPESHRPMPSGAHERPCDIELIQLVTAIVELAAGRRPPHALRDRLSEPLRQRLLTDPRPELGRHFVVNRVHCGRDGAHVLHVNATVHERTHAIAFGTSSCLTPRYWGGWQVIEFCLLEPSVRRRAPRAA